MLNLAHTLICIGIFWTSFTRAILMEKSTKTEIAYSMAFLGTMGFAMALAPIAWGTVISLPVTLLEASILGVQVVTGRLWSKGVPSAFQKP